MGDASNRWWWVIALWAVVGVVGGFLYFRMRRRQEILRRVWAEDDALAERKAEEENDPSKKGFLARFQKKPDWELPFLAETLLGAPLSYPFEGPGSEAGWVALDIGMSLFKQRFPRAERVVDGVPTILVADGRPLRERMRRARVNDDDVLERARTLQGLERMEQIRFAVLEPGGDISIVPMPCPW